MNYSEEYGFMIDGTYTKVEFATTLTGTKTEIIPVDGYFTVEEDGYVFVTGGNDTDTAIWMTWGDWTEEPNDGTWEAYSQTSIDLSGVMVNFPNGLMRVGNFYDEINLNTQRAYSRVQKLEYTAENLEDVIASGVPYDTDTGYIYAVRTLPVTYTINLSGDYTVNDHGTEMFLGTSIPVTVSALYGNDLKNKLRRDVLTISQQTLTAAQKAQVQANLGVPSQAEVDALNSNLNEIGSTQLLRSFTSTGASTLLEDSIRNYKFILAITTLNNLRLASTLIPVSILSTGDTIYCSFIGDDNAKRYASVTVNDDTHMKCALFSGVTKIDIFGIK